MSTEEKNNSDTIESKPTQIEKQNKFRAKLVAFLKNNKAASVLSLLLLVVLVWFSVKLRVNERDFNNEKTQLITQYENTIDSLQINQLEFASKVFSWSIRSEMLRNNLENLNQLLTVFVQESSADLVQIVNPESKVVMLSSDKKFEGAEYNKAVNFELNEPMVIREEQKVSIITPIMGFSNRIGVLIVEVKLK